MAAVFGFRLLPHSHLMIHVPPHPLDDPGNCGIEPVASLILQSLHTDSDLHDFLGSSEEIAQLVNCSLVEIIGF